MRSVLIAMMLALLALAPATAQHPGGMPHSAPAVPAADPLELLRGAQFFTVSGLTGEFPHGTFELHEGVVAMLPGGYPHALALGSMMADFSALPGYTPADGALNLFREIDGPDSTLGFYSLAAAYISAAPDSGLSITDDGTPVAERGWKELTDAERMQFEDVLAQCISDGWTQPGSAALREPVGAEIYAAFWLRGLDEVLDTRWDYRVDDDGDVSIEEYARGIIWYQYPWAKEEGTTTSEVYYKSIGYTYNLEAPQNLDPQASPLGRVLVTVWAEVRLAGAPQEPVIGSPEHDAAQPLPNITLVSDPHITWTEAVLHTGSVMQARVQAGKPLTINRPAAPASPWQLDLGGEFWNGNYTIELQGYCDIPEDFASFGYGGAYRFDETALWPGEDLPVDVTISANLWDGPYSCVGSAGLAIRNDTLRIEEEDRALATLTTGSAQQTTRNQMLVLTQFPSRTIPTNWGELEVYAPADLIDGVEQTEAVQAIGPIIDYYTALWGGREADKLPVFILPDETGVQGFMNAGMVFILGGEGGHGGAGSSMGGLTALLAHELAHLWWGQDVSAPRWFVEAMANYGAAKFLEQQAQASGTGDPYFYRRYLMNFALGYELPLSLSRRDELDDSAAIYHNGPACLLTLDARLAHGLDPVLAELWRDMRGKPELDNNQLREYFLKQSDPLFADLWDMYIERGIIPQSDDEDETYRELVRTPQRENYRSLLSWLMPARRKAASGDYVGAMYCADRAREFRAEPKDYQWLAELAFQAGRVDEALERCIVIIEDQQPDAAVLVKVSDLMARCYLAQGDTDSAIIEYQSVVRHGMEAGQIGLVKEAQARLEELGAEVPDIPTMDAATDAPTSTHGG